MTSFCCYEDPSSPGFCANPVTADGGYRTGVCKAVAGVGEDCRSANDLQLCQTGLECNFETFKCQVSSTEVLGLGEDCFVDFQILGDCESGLFCDNLGTGQCETQKPNGEACLAPFECESQLCTGGFCVVNDYCAAP